MDKATLRKVYLKKRRLLTSAVYRERNELLNNRLIDFVEKHGLRTIHIFFAIEKFKEVDLTKFISWCHHQAAIKLVGSVSDLKEARLEHFLIEKHTRLVLNKWGIPEPQHASKFDISTLDCVFVPMVIGSKTGQRIGYGKGYYDQFLIQCPAETSFVGLNLGPLLEGTIYAEAHDITMDYMLTPYQEFECKN